MSCAYDPRLYGVAVYNPALMSKEELTAAFIARRPLLERLKRDLKRPRFNEHQLLVGRRGMGKTTFLRRLQWAVEDDPELSGAWLPLWFPEEQYNVSRMSDLYENWLEAAVDALERERADELAGELTRGGDLLDGLEEEQRAARTLELLFHAADRIGKRFLLLIDNFDMLLERISASERWRLRELLQADARLLIVGATAAVGQSTASYGEAFYDFFHVHELRGVTDEETRAILVTMARLTGAEHVARLVASDMGRIQALHALTGGNPRTLILLFTVLAQSADGDVRSDLERLLDHATPLYKAMFEALPPQAQQVFHALATRWQPATAAEIAADTRLPTRIVSAQLTRLKQHQLVEAVTDGPKSRTTFLIGERFFNIWYLMRTNRRIRARFSWLVHMLKVIFTAEELMAWAERHLRSARPTSSSGRLRYAETAFTLAECVPDDGPLRTALETTGVRLFYEDEHLQKFVGELIGQDAKLAPIINTQQWVVDLSERIRKAKPRWGGWNVEEALELFGGSLSITQSEKLEIAIRLEELSEWQVSELIRILREEVGKFSRIHSSGLTDVLRRALRIGYMTAYDGDRTEMAAAAHALQSLELAAFASPQTREWLEDAVSREPNRAYLWYELGLRYRDAAQAEDAVQALRRAVQLDPGFKHAVLAVLKLLTDAGAHAEAEAVLVRAVEADPNNDALWYKLAYIQHYRMKQYDAAEDAYCRALTLQRSYDTVVDYAYLLETQRSRFGDAEALYREAAELQPKRGYPKRAIARIQLARGEVDAALNTYRQAVDTGVTDAQLLNSFAWVLYTHAIDLDEAETLARKAVAARGDDPYAMHTLATILLARGNWDEAAALARTFLPRVEREFDAELWVEMVAFFVEALRHGKGNETAELLDELGLVERWQPIYVALLAIGSGNRRILKAVAPEVRVVAEKVITMFENAS